MKIHRIAAFTHHGKGGNPAGVVLTDAFPAVGDMQNIAADVGYSETAFAALAEDAWQVRYFSPETEVPFCGHATIALGAVLGQDKGPGLYDLALTQGRIAVEALEIEGQPYALLSSPPTRSEPASESLVEEALALFNYARGDLDPALPPMRANAGAEHLVIALSSREVLARMHYNLDVGRAFMRRHGFVTVDFIWRAAERLFHARNAFASGGVLEDPATGAAAAALAGMLRDRGVLTAGMLTILQGEDMGRPSKIDVSFLAECGAPVRVGGAVATICRD